MAEISCGLVTLPQLCPAQNAAAIAEPVIAARLPIVGDSGCVVRVLISGMPILALGRHAHSSANGLRDCHMGFLRHESCLNFGYKDEWEI